MREISCIHKQLGNQLASRETKERTKIQLIFPDKSGYKPISEKPSPNIAVQRASKSNCPLTARPFEYMPAAVHKFYGQDET